MARQSPRLIFVIKIPWFSTIPNPPHRSMKPFPLLILDREYLEYSSASKS